MDSAGALDALETRSDSSRSIAIPPEAGDRLPSRRELAEQLVIAPLTVKKAYDELERVGLIHTQRGKGTFISERLPAVDPATRRERLRDNAQRLLSQGG